jgi:hypothetical protein
MIIEMVMIIEINSEGVAYVTLSGFQDYGKPFNSIKMTSLQD